MQSRACNETQLRLAKNANHTGKNGLEKSNVSYVQPHSAIANWNKGNPKLRMKPQMEHLFPPSLTHPELLLLP